METSAQAVVQVPLCLLSPGDSPRLAGLDADHIVRLAELDTAFPPILVDRDGLRVVDGMHRLMAAALRHQATIDVVFFDGSPADVFLRAVEENVTHGLPLSQADRRAATVRLLASHPHLSDRAISRSAGLSRTTVASLRRRDGEPAAPPGAARVGQDGRVRPLNVDGGRRRAAEILRESPYTSLREVARDAGISLGTASDVRRRLARGADPVPTAAVDRPAPAAADSAPVRLSRAAAGRAQPDPSLTLEKLARDPSLRLSETGRALIGLLRHNAVGSRERSTLLASVPLHCRAMVAQLAGQYAQLWQEFAKELDAHPRTPLRVVAED